MSSEEQDNLLCHTPALETLIRVVTTHHKSSGGVPAPETLRQNTHTENGNPHPVYKGKGNGMGRGGWAGS